MSEDVGTPHWWRSCRTVHQGPQRLVRFAILRGESSPARDFLEGLWRSKRNKATDFLAILKHLADNLTHRHFKNWEDPDDTHMLRQISTGDYRIIAVEEQIGGTRTLTLLYGFNKHTRKTSRSDVTAIRSIYRTYRAQHDQA